MEEGITPALPKGFTIVSEDETTPPLPKGFTPIEDVSKKKVSTEPATTVSEGGGIPSASAPPYTGKSLSEQLKPSAEGNVQPEQVQPKVSKKDQELEQIDQPKIPSFNGQINIPTQGNDYMVQEKGLPPNTNRQALAEDPNLSHINQKQELYEEGNKLSEQGDHVGALSLALEALKTDPNNRLFQFQAAYNMQQTGDLNEAKRIYQQILDNPDPKSKIQPDIVKANLANIALQEGKHKEAQQLSQDVLKHNPDVESAYLTLANSYAATGDKDKAKQVFETGKQVHALNQPILSVGAPGTKEYEEAQRAKNIADLFDSETFPSATGWNKFAKFLVNPIGSYSALVGGGIKGAGEKIQEGIEDIDKAMNVGGTGNMVGGILKTINGIASGLFQGAMAGTPEGLAFMTANEIAPEKLNEAFMKPVTTVINILSDNNSPIKNETLREGTDLLDLAGSMLLMAKLHPEIKNTKAADIGNKILNREELSPDEAALSNKIIESKVGKDLLNQTNDMLQSMPAALSEEQRKAILPKLIELKSLKLDNENIDEVFRKANNEKIKELENQIQIIQTEPSPTVEWSGEEVKPSKKTQDAGKIESTVKVGEQPIRKESIGDKGSEGMEQGDKGKEVAGEGEGEEVKVVSPAEREKVIKYDDEELNDFAKNSKFKTSKSNDYTYFNINGEKQIRITKAKNKKSGAGEGYRVTLHTLNEDGYTTKEGYDANIKAETLKEAKIEAAKLYFNEIRKDVSESIDITDKGGNLIPPTEPTKAEAEKTGKEIEPHKEVKANKTIAIKEIAPNYGLKEMEAGILHGLKDLSPDEIFDIANDEKSMKSAFIKKLFDKGFIDFDYEMPSKNAGDYYKLTDKGKQFIDAVDARIETRKGVKEGTDLFPEDANIPEFKAIKKELKTNTDEPTINKFERRTKDEVEKSEPTITSLEAKGEDAANNQDKQAAAEVIGEIDRLIESEQIAPKESTLEITRQAESLYNQISEAEGGAKKRSLAAERQKLLEDHPEIKRIDDNIKSITQQLEDAGLLKKKGNCP